MLYGIICLFYVWVGWVLVIVLMFIGMFNKIVMIVGVWF